jgi:hypothetical protein
MKQFKVQGWFQVPGSIPPLNGVRGMYDYFSFNPLYLYNQYSPKLLTNYSVLTTPY